MGTYLLVNGTTTNYQVSTNNGYTYFETTVYTATNEIDNDFDESNIIYSAITPAILL